MALRSKSFTAMPDKAGQASRSRSVALARSAKPIKREPQATDRVDRRTPEHVGMIRQCSGFEAPCTELGESTRMSAVSPKAPFFRATRTRFDGGDVL